MAGMQCLSVVTNTRGLRRGRRELQDKLNVERKLRLKLEKILRKEKSSNLRWHRKHLRALKCTICHERSSTKSFSAHLPYSYVLYLPQTAPHLAPSSAHLITLPIVYN
jgi:hypothetical protein